jgi:hypothetical protein
MNLADRLDRIESLLLKALGKCPPPEPFLSAREFANRVGRSHETIARYCRLGRLNATRSNKRCGPVLGWILPAAEVQRFETEGPLPVKPEPTEGI